MEENRSHPPKICHFLNGIIKRFGECLAWLNVLLILIIIIQVVLRYAFNNGLVYLEELQWHLYGTLIMFGIGYGITTDSHIRLDIIHRKMSTKVKGIVEILGILFLLFPLVFVLFIHGIDFVESSYRVAEASDSPLGLPHRWIIKSVIPLSMLYVAIAALSRLIQAFASLKQPHQQ